MREPKLLLHPGIEHFGEQLRASRFGHKMTRELYAYPNRKPKERPRREDWPEEVWNDSAWMYRDEEHTEHSDVFLLAYRDAALTNFDLSMKYFSSLDQDDFEGALDHVLTKGRTFKPVQSLKPWDGVSGAYIMVFDEYRQFYIGQSNDIRSRIKKHWTHRKPFDRVLFGTRYDSIFPVDELRALDTTRIFAARSTNPYALEERTEKAADQRYCLNRMSGGEPPLTVMLGSHLPRNRSHGLAAVPLSPEDYDLEWDKVSLVISQARTSQNPNLVETLAGLDMTIYAVPREERPPYLWSRRDAVAGAAARGELTVEEYAVFLKLMGEKVIWPEC